MDIYVYAMKNIDNIEASELYALKLKGTIVVATQVSQQATWAVAG
jgi:hypothetical protein